MGQSESLHGDNKIVLEFKLELAHQANAEATTLVTAIKAHKSICQLIGHVTPSRPYPPIRNAPPAPSICHRFWRTTSPIESHLSKAWVRW